MRQTLLRWFQHDAVLLAALLAVVVVCVLPVLTYPMGRDQGEFATIGSGILDGRIPYVDLWNPKPPAIFYVYALFIRLFGHSTETLRLIDLFIAPATAAAVFWIGRRIANRRVGLWAALIFSTFYFTESFWTLSQNDGIGALPMALAVVGAFKAADTLDANRRRSALWAFVTGACCALALWFKYPFVLFVVTLVVSYIWLRRGVGARCIAPLRDRREWLNIAAFTGGGLLIGLAGIVYMASLGALGALVESARVTSGYTALGFNLQDFAQAMQTAVVFRWSQWGLMLILATLWVIKRSAKEKDERVGGWPVIGLWLLAGTAILLIQAKGYDYHWLPMLPPLALFAADSLDWLLSILSPSFLWLRFLAAAGLCAVMVAVIWGKAWPYLTGKEDQLAYDRHFQGGELVADESQQVANYLRQRVAPGDSLYIWGFRPEVYYLSDLHPATRFIFQYPLVADWYPREWQQQNVDVLWAALPPYVLVLQVDYMPWVTGSHDDSNTLLQGYTELYNWLIYNYERDTQIGNFFVWRRKPGLR